ncbi:hypothetical protein [Streptomyces sp. NPDC087297]|uniref:hypothetical protein n=1 Tax=Streptomyces sp. NPDC087297 TaxID=3365778 RepID=UPI00382BB39C
MDEYLRLSHAIGGVPAQRMEEAFRRLDRDGNGTLDPAEIDAAVVEFFTGEDPQMPRALFNRAAVPGPERVLHALGMRGAHTWMTVAGRGISPGRGQARGTGRVPCGHATALIGQHSGSLAGRPARATPPAVHRQSPARSFHALGPVAVVLLP